MKKRLLYIFLMLLPLSSVAGTLSYFFMINSETKKVEIENNILSTPEAEYSLFDRVDIFPEIKQEDFYKYIRIREGKPQITEKMISNIIKKVVQEMKVTEGNVYIEWKKVNDEKSKIIFLWKNSNLKMYWKTYDISLSV